MQIMRLSGSVFDANQQGVASASHRQYLSISLMYSSDPTNLRMKGATPGVLKRRSFRSSLQDLGLAQLGYVDHGKVGGKDYKTLQITEMQDAKTLRENFPQWIMSNVIPALEKKGITDIGGQAAAVNNILSNRTGSNLGVAFATQFIQTLRDAKMVKNAMGVDATINAFKNDPNSRFADLQTKWNGLMVELGITVLPIAIAALEKLIPLVRSMSDWISKNQGLAKGLAVAFIGLAAGLAINGTVLLLAASFKGLGLAMAMKSVGGIAGVGALGATLGTVAGGLLALVGAVSALAWLANFIAPNDKHPEGTAAAARWGRGGGRKPAADAPVDAHAGETFIRSGRGGYWKKDTTFVKPAASNKSPQSSGDVYLDKQKVGKILTEQQAREAGRPQSGSGRFDPNMSLASPGQAIR